MNLLLDTSIIIDFLRRKDKEAALLTQFVKEGHHQFSVSIITHTELFSGKSVWQDQTLYEALETLLSGCDIFPLDDVTSQKAEKIRATYNTDLVDAIIAATAISHEFPLVTFNEKDFLKIPRLKLFTI